ncbi:hypothetical protein GOV07_00660, partial [Candidatus Woesearchaeota archaeon]|nr:hypothetical protein [Candidatus Woesearchaeota archaeon]
MASATTYYVDATGGNDGNNGTSEGSAWQTIAQVNSQTQNPGDIVLFKRGETWRERLYVDSGNSTHRTTYSSYGTGAQPRIRGDNIITGWQVYSGNIYNISLSTEPEQLWINGTFGDRIYITNNATNNITNNLTNNFDWWWNSTTQVLYLYDSNGNPDSTNTTVEAGQRNEAISFDNSNVNIANITVSHVNRYGIFGDNPNNITITNVTAEWNFHHGIGTTGNAVHGNITVQDSIARYNGISGVTFGVYNIATPTSGYRIRRNKIYENAIYQKVWNDDFRWTGGIKFWGPAGMDDVIIEYNEVYDNGLPDNYGPTPNNYQSRPVGIWMDIASPTNQSEPNIIRYNRINTTGRNGIFLESTHDTIVHHNILYDNAQETSGYGDWANAAIKIDSRGTSAGSRNKIYNNIIVKAFIGVQVSSYTGTIGLGQPTQHGEVRNNSIENNIFVDINKTVLRAYEGGDNNGSYGSGNVYEYNAFGLERTEFIQWGPDG